MVSIGFLRCEKIRRDLVPQTFALIAPVRPDLHSILYSNKMGKSTRTLRNTPEHEVRIQWYGSGAFVAKNSNATSLHDFQRVLCSNEMFPNAPKHYKMLQDISLGCNGMDRLRLLRKNSDATSLHELLH